MLFVQEGMPPVSGTFKLRSGQLETLPLSWGVSPEDLQSAIRNSLAAVSRGVLVSMLDGDPTQGFNYSVTFGG